MEWAVLVVQGLAAAAALALAAGDERQEVLAGQRGHRRPDLWPITTRRSAPPAAKG